MKALSTDETMLLAISPLVTSGVRAFPTRLWPIAVRARLSRSLKIRHKIETHGYIPPSLRDEKRDVTDSANAADSENTAESVDEVSASGSQDLSDATVAD